MMQRLQRWSLGLGMACLLVAAPSFVNAQGAPAAAKNATTKKGGKAVPSSPIDINTASQAELESVPGIGTPTAKKIIAGRPFSSVADLSKAGISAAQIKNLAPMLKVSGSPAATAKAAAPSAPSMPTTPSAPNTPSKSATSKPSPTTAAAAASCSADMVWVNTETKVYHKSGDKYFANTKRGKCMSEGDAQKAGYHLSGQKQKAS